MSSLPRLDLVADPPGATELVILAHGGRESSRQAPTDWGYGILRIWPIAEAAAEAAPQAAIGLVRYRHRGWNEDGDPLHDLARVLDAARDHGFERIVLVGHSMGGRAVVGAGAHPLVCGVVALAPWLPRGEPVPDLDERLVVFAHGSGDVTTSPVLTATFAARARARGLALCAFDVDGEVHALLRRDRDCNELVRRAVAAAISGVVDDVLAVARSDDPDHGTDALPAWHRRRSAGAAVASIIGARRRFRRRRSIELD